MKGPTNISLLFLLPVFALHTGSLKSQQYSEYEVKAAFLINFAKFVQWPAEMEEKDGPVTIGILGQDPFGSVLDNMSRIVKVNNKSILVERYVDVTKAKNCFILFISASENSKMKDHLSNLKGTNVLTVSEVDGFCNAGGMINYSQQKIKYGFEINNKAARESNLKISSKLLNLASRVYD